MGKNYKIHKKRKHGSIKCNHIKVKNVNQDYNETIKSEIIKDKSDFTLIILIEENKFLQNEENHIENQSNKKVGGEKMEIKSSAFDEGAFIPRKYTCDGNDFSPPLEWALVPDGTKAFAVICEDPDAPMGTWVHWILFNLPGNINELSENIPPQEVLANGARQGKNDFRKIGYGGPCPPGGTHRYYFKIYALDEELDVGSGISKKELLKAMEGHILAEGQLVGRYKR